MEQTISKNEQRFEDATDKLLDLEARSMRENLIFYGLPEVQTQGGEMMTQSENCEQLVKELISNKMQMDPSSITMDRAHRLGGPRAKKPRPIIVKFHRYSDREDVRMKSRDTTIKTALNGSNLGVGVQQPQQYREARKALSDYAKTEEERGNKARIVGNKLFVNNKMTKKFVDGSVRDQPQARH